MRCGKGMNSVAANQNGGNGDPSGAGVPAWAMEPSRIWRHGTSGMGGHSLLPAGDPACSLEVAP